MSTSIPIYMYDGVNSLAPVISQLFPHADMIAGYLSGSFAWAESDWGRFPQATHISIATSAAVNAGDVLDVEQGDATPSQTAGWIAMRKAAGYYRPTIYCSLSAIPAVRAGTGGYILAQDYDIWVAWYMGSPIQVAAQGLPAANCVATQYMSTAEYDVSAVFDPDWPHRAAPVPPVPPTPPAPPTYPVPNGLTAAVSIGSISATLAWISTGSPHYRYQVAEGTPASPGAVFAFDTIVGTTATVALPGKGPWVWHVQSAGNSPFTPWQAITL